MAGNRDTNKRLKAIGIPIEICVKYERFCGIQPGHKLSFTEKFRVSEAMISALEAGVHNVQLSSEDYQLIAEEVRRNEESRMQPELPGLSREDELKLNSQKGGQKK